MACDRAGRVTRPDRRKHAENTALLAPALPRHLARGGAVGAACGTRAVDLGHHRPSSKQPGEADGGRGERQRQGGMRRRRRRARRRRPSRSTSTSRVQGACRACREPTVRMASPVSRAPTRHRASRGREVLQAHRRRSRDRRDLKVLPQTFPVRPVNPEPVVRPAQSVLRAQSAQPAPQEGSDLPVPLDRQARWVQPAPWDQQGHRDRRVSPVSPPDLRDRRARRVTPDPQAHRELKAQPGHAVTPVPEDQQV